MKILYHIFRFEPWWEAAAKEVSLLSTRHDGGVHEIDHLAEKKYRLVAPVAWALRRRHSTEPSRDEHEYDLHHFFLPDTATPKYFRELKKPKLVTITGGIASDENGGPARENVEQLHKLARQVKHLVVADGELAGFLRRDGIDNVSAIRPGIALTPAPLPPPPDGRFRLCFASSPFAHFQMESRGVISLLKAAASDGELELTLMWRGRLNRKIKDEVEKHGIADRVEIISGVVDIMDILMRCHAVVAPFQTPEHNMPFPRSCVEALSAGRPVLVTDVTAIGKVVSEEGGGIAVTPTAEGLVGGVEKLRKGYAGDFPFSEHARAVCERFFSLDEYFSAYAALYESII
ncbi:MAG: glycosyltransferase [Planctomycetota bacterium]